MSKLVVLLDNGHGADTPGKCSPDKVITEWSWCRKVVFLISDKLRKLNIEVRSVYPAMLENGQKRALKERVSYINELTQQAHAAGKETIMISVHINAALGISAWQEDLVASGERTKVATGWSGFVRKNIKNKEIDDKSRTLASLLYEQCTNYHLEGNRCKPADGYWTGDLYILNGSNCPSVLTENLFQDSREQVNLLTDSRVVDNIVNLHVNAIKKYIQHYHLQ